MKLWPLLVLLVSPFVRAPDARVFTEQPVVRAHFDQTRTIDLWDLRARC